MTGNKSIGDKFPTGIIKPTDIEDSDNIKNITNVPQEYIDTSVGIVRNAKRIIRYYTTIDDRNTKPLTDKELIKQIAGLKRNGELKSYNITTSNKGLLSYDFKHTYLNQKQLKGYKYHPSIKLVKCLYVDRSKNQFLWKNQLINFNTELTNKNELVLKGMARKIRQWKELVNTKRITTKQLDGTIIQLKRNKLTIDEAQEQINNYIETNWINKIQGI